MYNGLLTVAYNLLDVGRPGLAPFPEWCSLVISAQPLVISSNLITFPINQKALNCLNEPNFRSTQNLAASRASRARTSPRWTSTSPGTSAPVRRAVAVGTMLIQTHPGNPYHSLYSTLEK
jgi:hypothetical protein